MFEGEKQRKEIKISKSLLTIQVLPTAWQAQPPVPHTALWAVHSRWTRISGGVQGRRANHGKGGATGYFRVKILLYRISCSCEGAVKAGDR